MTQKVNPIDPPTVATGRRKRLGRIAWWLTGLWALVFVLGLLTKLEDVPVMSLNEWGDFFAGAAAPLALLWLVIGYYQHGEELRLNTQGLYAQQLELQKQADETAQLVEATRENVRILQARDAREAAPEFRFGGSRSVGRELSLIIRNFGATVHDVKVKYRGPHEYTLLERDIMPTSTEIEPVFHGDTPLEYPIRFWVYCVDKLGNDHDMEFEIPAENRPFRLISSGVTEP